MIITKIVLAIYAVALSTIGFKKYKQLIFILALQLFTGIHPVGIPVFGGCISAALSFHHKEHHYIASCMDSVLILCCLFEGISMHIVIWSHLSSLLMTLASLHLFELVAGRA
jgi:hypothetical protein